jgi:hypothetical protein
MHLDKHAGFVPHVTYKSMCLYVCLCPHLCENAVQIGVLCETLDRRVRLVHAVRGQRLLRLVPHHIASNRITYMRDHTYIYEHT